MIGTCVRSGRRFAAFAAMAGILLQLFIVAVHGPARARPAVAALPPAETVVICTAHGASTVSLDVEGNPVEPVVPVQHPAACDLCLGLNALSIAPPGESFLLTIAPVREALARSADTRRPARSERANRNRGPPSQSIA